MKSIYFSECLHPHKRPLILVRSFDHDSCIMLLVQMRHPRGSKKSASTLPSENILEIVPVFTGRLGRILPIIAQI